MNPLFLTARSAGLKTISVAQVGSSLDKKVTPEFFYTEGLHPDSAEVVGGEVKIVTLALWKESFQYLPAEIRKHTITILGRSQNMCYKTVYVKQSPTCLIQILPPTKLTNLQRKMSAKMDWHALTYPLEPNDFVVLKLANKENNEILCWADRINGA
jgi:hypothetical protein